MLANIFQRLWQTINGWLDNLFGLDDLIHGITDYFWQLDALFRILILAFLAIIIILGVVSFIKKIFKVFIVIIVIIGVYLIVKTRT